MKAKDMKVRQPLESRVSAVESELQQFISISDERHKETTGAIKGVGDDVKKLAEKLGDKTGTKSSTIIGWASIIVAIILGVCTIMISLGALVSENMTQTANRDRQDSVTRYMELDTKLQKETSLALDASKQQIIALNDMSMARRESSMRDEAVLENNEIKDVANLQKQIDKLSPLIIDVASLQAKIESKP